MTRDTPSGRKGTRPKVQRWRCGADPACLWGSSWRHLAPSWAALASKAPMTPPPPRHCGRPSPAAAQKVAAPGPWAGHRRLFPGGPDHGPTQWVLPGLSTDGGPSGAFPSSRLATEPRLAWRSPDPAPKFVLWNRSTLPWLCHSLCPPLSAPGHRPRELWQTGAHESLGRTERRPHLAVPEPDRGGKARAGVRPVPAQGPPHPRQKGTACASALARLPPAGAQAHFLRIHLRASRGRGAGAGSSGDTTAWSRPTRGWGSFHRRSQSVLGRKQEEELGYLFLRTPTPSVSGCLTNCNRGK